MRRNILTFSFAASIIFASAALACGPEGSLASGGRANFGAFPSSGVRGLEGFGQQVNPFGVMSAAQQAQINQARQNFGAQAAAYRARMKPIRQAAAAQKRQEMLAKREQYRQILAAKLNAKKMEQAQPQQRPDFEIESPFREVTPEPEQQQAPSSARFVFTSTNLSP